MTLDNLLKPYSLPLLQVKKAGRGLLGTKNIAEKIIVFDPVVMVM